MIGLDQIRRAVEAHPPARLENEERLRAAAVLVPFVSGEGGALELLLSRRTETLSLHAGQIAFPGGAADPGDAGRVDTALRETEEELGIARSEIEVIGELDHARTSSDFAVTPVVGHLALRPKVRPSAAEVAGVLYVPFDVFVREDTMEIRDYLDPKTGLERKGVIFYRFGEDVVWGATARIIKRLVDRIVASSAVLP